MLSSEGYDVKSVLSAFRANCILNVSSWNCTFDQNVHRKNWDLKWSARHTKETCNIYSQQTFYTLSISECIKVGVVDYFVILTNIGRRFMNATVGRCENFNLFIRQSNHGSGPIDGGFLIIDARLRIQRAGRKWEIEVCLKVTRGCFGGGIIIFPNAHLEKLRSRGLNAEMLSSGCDVFNLRPARGGVVRGEEGRCFKLPSRRQIRIM